MGKKRIVVKIGSSSLTNEKGEIDQEQLHEHIYALSALRQENHDVILVSSGAVAAGFTGLGYSSRPVTIKGKQAAAAVGQGLLIQTYIEKFKEFNITSAQLLLTRNDFSNRERYRNAFATITELLDRGVLPIINENDTVSVEELTFGDNDMLSALVSGFVHADQLIILTDINGLYDGNPRKNPFANRIDFLEDITDDMVNGTDDTASKVGTGGMKSKLLAAKTAMTLGVPVFIGYGRGSQKLLDILHGNGDGTYIASRHGAVNTRKQWIALHSETTGTIYVDQGAEEAILYNGKSLLPAGVFNVKGTFHKGDVVNVYGTSGFLGKGEINWSSDEIKKTVEKRDDARGVAKSAEVIHRDGWVKMGSE
ncbi:glutamate 5-kinase [Virgibacillus sp. NKC19-16]|uniref:glutamate 5-kinase n=1 Tax=Virgibacillus salidurans TaxID=2831673 RepID=UPI001F429292|nr:glutamate 5-kinase [Virgibacillus sp. NKC19-16]UJL47385.1 glutamate 5-kinase [Virgibacillus sp. NKC19-16]